MSEQEKPLPKPPTTPFGRKKRYEQSEPEQPLMADRLAMAMAEGNLDEYMQKEVYDNEYAKALTMMMMGMTGLTPPASFVAPGHTRAGESRADEASAEECGCSAAAETSPPSAPSESAQPPEDLVAAALSGDIQNVMAMLYREHKKLNPDSAFAEPPGERKSAPSGPLEHCPAEKEIAEKEIIDQLIAIAGENGLSLDWVILRALRLYIKEYGKTGRL